MTTDLNPKALEAATTAVIEALTVRSPEGTWVGEGGSPAVLMVDGKVDVSYLAQAAVRAYLAALPAEASGWFSLSGDARLGACATEGCGGQPTWWRLEAGGAGSDYCDGCKDKIVGRHPAPSSATSEQAATDIVADYPDIPEEIRDELIGDIALTIDAAVSLAELATLNGGIERIEKRLKASEMAREKARK